MHTNANNNASAVKVVGGKADKKDSPFVVGLLLRETPNDDPAYCTGSIVRHDLIITAAHCLEDGITEVTPYDYEGGVLYNMDIKSIGQFTFPGFAQHAASGVDQALAMDVAFVVFPAHSFDSDEFNHIGEFATHSPARGEDVDLIGYGFKNPHNAPANFLKNRSTGSNRVADLLPNMANSIMLSTSEVSSSSAVGGEGDSGGPLLSADGTIYGIDNAGSTDGDIDVDHIKKKDVDSDHRLLEYYINVNDPGVAAFIAATLGDQHPSAATVAGIKPTKVTE